MAPPQSSDHLAKVGKEGFAELEKHLGRQKVAKPPLEAAQGGQPRQTRGSNEVPPARDVAAKGGGRVSATKDAAAITCIEAARCYNGTVVLIYKKIEKKPIGARAA